MNLALTVDQRIFFHSILLQVYGPSFDVKNIFWCERYRSHAALYLLLYLLTWKSQVQHSFSSYRLPQGAKNSTTLYLSICTLNKFWWILKNKAVSGGGASIQQWVCPLTTYQWKHREPNIWDMWPADSCWKMKHAKEGSKRVSSFMLHSIGKQYSRLSEFALWDLYQRLFVCLF